MTLSLNTNITLVLNNPTLTTYTKRSLQSAILDQFSCQYQLCYDPQPFGKDSESQVPSGLMRSHLGLPSCQLELTGRISHHKTL